MVLSTPLQLSSNILGLGNYASIHLLPMPFMILLIFFFTSPLSYHLFTLNFKLFNIILLHQYSLLPLITKAYFPKTFICGSTQGANNLVLKELF